MDLENTFQFNNGDEGDDEKQCRTCLEQHSKHQLHSLDSQKHTVLNDGSEQTIAEIYHQCTQLLYVSDDAHFKWICQLCLEKLVDFYQFRKICIDSYHKLKQNEIMKDTLKLEAVDDYGDSSTFAMELDEATVIKRESFDCNTDQMNERSNVSMDEPVENTLVQSEQRDLDAVKADAADSTAFDDCIDDDGDSSNTSEIEVNYVSNNPIYSYFVNSVALRNNFSIYSKISYRLKLIAAKVAHFMHVTNVRGDFSKNLDLMHTCVVIWV